MDFVWIEEFMAYDESTQNKIETLIQRIREEEVKGTLPKLASTINFCGCIGPINGEEHCPCRMKALGLKTDKDYEWSEEEKEEFKKALSKMFDWED